MRTKAASVWKIPPGSIRWNFAWTIAGNATYVGCQWGIVVILAKMSKPETVGIFTLALAVIAPVFLLTNIGLRAVLVTEQSKDDTGFKNYVATRLVTSTIGAIIIAGIAIVSGYSGPMLAVVTVMCLAKWVESISDITYGLFQQQERMELISRSMIRKGLGSLCGVTLAMTLTHNLVIAVSVLCLVWIAVFLSFDLRNARVVQRAKVAHDGSGPARISARHMLSLVKTSFPLGGAAMLGSVNSNMPRYFLEAFVGPKGVGLFSAIAYFMTANNLIITALAESAVARLAVYSTSGRCREQKRLLIRLCIFGATIGAVALTVVALAGGKILRIVYTPEYASYQNVFVILMFSACLRNVLSFLGTALTAARRFAIQPAIFAATGVASAALCVTLIPRAGLTGASGAVVLTDALQLTLFLITVIVVLRKTSRVQVESKEILA